jgi:hypothetical protein
MQRQIGTLRTTGLVGLVGLATLGGCAASGGDESILVLKNVAPPTSATAGACAFTPAETEVGLVRGVLDTSARTGYEFMAQLRSRIIASSGQEDARTILLRGANVDLTFTDATLLGAAELADLQSKNLLHFMSPFSAPLAPNGGLTDAPFELIPAGVATALDGKAGFTSTVVQAKFTIVGDLAGGSVSSQAFSYSVTLGHGILLANNGPCAMLEASFAARTGNPCFPGQDAIIDCCTSPAGAAVCPAVGTGM